MAHHTWIIAFSGGKDSTATLLWSLEQNPPDMKIVFFDTGAEWPETYDYLNLIERLLKIRITRLSGDQSLSELITSQGRWPAHQIRFCTRRLKAEVFENWIRTTNHPNPLVLFGQRKEESRNRARLLKYEPPPFGPAGAAVLRPVLDWTEQQVFDYLKRKGIPPNPAYSYPGVKRVSCAVCPLTGISNIIAFARAHPDRLKAYKSLEKIAGPWKKTISLYGSRRSISISDVESRANLNDADYVTTREASVLTGISPRMIRQKALKGELPNSRQINPGVRGSPWLIALQDLPVQQTCISGLCDI